MTQQPLMLSKSLLLVFSDSLYTIILGVSLKKNCWLMQFFSEKMCLRKVRIIKKTFVILSEFQIAKFVTETWTLPYYDLAIKIIHLWNELIHLKARTARWFDINSTARDTILKSSQKPNLLLYFACSEHKPGQIDLRNNPRKLKVDDANTESEVCALCRNLVM